MRFNNDLELLQDGLILRVQSACKSPSNVEFQTTRKSSTWVEMFSAATDDCLLSGQATEILTTYARKTSQAARTE